LYRPNLKKLNLKMLFKISLLALAVASFVSATPRQYNDFQISTGVGGNASAEAISEFPGALDSLTGTAESDVNVRLVLLTRNT